MITGDLDTGDFGPRIIKSPVICLEGGLIIDDVISDEIGGSISLVKDGSEINPDLRGDTIFSGKGKPHSSSHR